MDNPGEAATKDTDRKFEDGQEKQKVHPEKEIHETREAGPTGSTMEVGTEIPAELVVEELEETTTEEEQKGLSGGSTQDVTRGPSEVTLEEIGSLVTLEDTDEEERKNLTGGEAQNVTPRTSKVTVEEIEEAKEKKSLTSGGDTRDVTQRPKEVILEEIEEAEEEERKTLMLGDDTQEAIQRPREVMVEVIEEAEDEMWKDQVVPDDIEEPLEVGLKEPVRDEAPQVAWKKFKEDLQLKEELQQQEEEEQSTSAELGAKRKSMYSWERSDSVISKHEVDKLMSVKEEEEEEEEEEDLSKKKGTIAQKSARTTAIEKIRPLMIAIGYFSRLYKVQSKRRESEEASRKKESVDLGDRFYRFTKLFTPEDKKKAEEEKWLYTPRLTRPLRRSFHAMDIRSRKDKEDEKSQTGSKSGKAECDSFFSFKGVPSGVWSMGQRISHWRLAHSRSYRIDSFTRDKSYKHRLIKHEQDIKTGIPLPLQDLIEEEALIILMETLYDYQHKLGMYHPLSIELEDQVDKLNGELQARGIST